MDALFILKVGYTLIALSGKEGTFLAGFLGMKTLISIQHITFLYIYRLGHAGQQKIVILKRISITFKENYTIFI